MKKLLLVEMEVPSDPIALYGPSVRFENEVRGILSRYYVQGPPKDFNIRVLSVSVAKAEELQRKAAALDFMEQQLTCTDINLTESDGTYWYLGYGALGEGAPTLLAVIEAARKEQNA